MVVFPPVGNPDQLSAYSSFPLSDAVKNGISNEFAAGSFARFGYPLEVLTIHDNPDYHNLSAFEVRERLDMAGLPSSFGYIDETAITQPHYPIWWVASHEDSEEFTRDFTAEGYPPVQHPDSGESYVVWKLHVLTQDMPLQYTNWDVGTFFMYDPIFELVDPYDSYNPQKPAYTFHINFSIEAEGSSWLYPPYIVALFDEVDLRQGLTPLPKPNGTVPESPPPWEVRLKPDVAESVGLIPQWKPGTGPQLPKAGEGIRFQQPYNWTSPRWKLDPGATAISMGCNSPAPVTPQRRRRRWNRRTVNHNSSPQGDDGTVIVSPASSLTCQDLDIPDIAGYIKSETQYRLSSTTPNLAGYIRPIPKYRVNETLISPVATS